MSHATIGRELSIPANPQHPFDAPVRGTGSVALLCGLAVEHGLPRRDVLAGELPASVAADRILAAYDEE